MSGLGLLDYRARFYSASLGRFVQPDTVIPDPGSSQSWNRYASVLNNPVKYTDPSGHFPWLIIPLIGLAIAASQIPSDVPQLDPERHGSAEVMAVGLAIAAEPLDWLITAYQCVTQGCDPVLASQALMPGPSVSVVGNAADELLDAADNHLDEFSQGASITSSKLDDIKSGVEDWLRQEGDDLIPKINDDGDFILRNKLNTRRFRWDYNNPSPHQNPHMHLDWIDDTGKWTGSGQIWPTDVDPY